MSHEHIEEYDPARSVFRIAEIALNGPIIPGTLKGAIRLLTTYEKQFRGVIAELRARLVIGSLPIVEDVQKAPLFNDTHLHDDFTLSIKTV